MNISHLVFMYVVEESSISKAAQRAFITQQCASDHIKRLEMQYGTKLFYRKPRFTPTPAGQVLLQTLNQMKLLEKNLDQRLNEIKQGTTGHIHFGITAPRAHLILPGFLKRYNQLLPHVKVSIISSDTRSLEQHFVKGDIDLFVGVNTKDIPNARPSVLARDQIFFLATQELLSRFETTPELIQDSIQRDAFFSSITWLPIARNTNDSAFSQLISQYLEYHHASLYSPFHTNDYDMQIDLCISGVSAAFCPTLMLKKVIALNKTLAPQNRILIFPLIHIPQHLRFELVTWNNMHDIAYTASFIELFKEEVTRCYESIREEVGP